MADNVKAAIYFNVDSFHIKLGDAFLFYVQGLLTESSGLHINLLFALSYLLSQLINFSLAFLDLVTRPGAPPLKENFGRVSSFCLRQSLCFLR
jgi:hypothetical protein